MKWLVSLSDVNFDEEEVNAVQAVIKSGWLSMGSITESFEAEFAEFVSAKYAFAVTNATAALHLACLALGLKPGDEVIVPSLTFVATANAIRYTGATPIFADIESEDRLLISPTSISELISERTKAIMVMHYAGYPCDMPSILEIANEHQLPVIEDAAHAVGASLDGKSMGTWGDIGCFSFFANKNMTTGEGGMLVTNNEVMAEKVRILRSHGMTTLTWDRYKGHANLYDVIDLGYNYRIDELRSALGKVQLKKIPTGNEKRSAIVNLYRELIADLVPEVHVPFTTSPGVSSHYIFPILLPINTDKNQFMNAMKVQGIQTSWHYPPVHTFEIYKQNHQSLGRSLIVTEQTAPRLVTLPLYPTMTEANVRLVVEVMKKSLDQVIKN